MQTAFLQVTKPEMIFLESTLRLYKNIEMAVKIRNKINVLSKHDIQTSPAQIIVRVCQLTGLTIDDMQGRKRNRKITDARACASRLMKDYFPELHITDIGRHLNKNHSTIIHQLESVENVSEIKKMYLDLKLKL